MKNVNFLNATKKLVLIGFLLINPCLCLSYESNYCPSYSYPIYDVVDKKICQEKKDNAFLISLYEPNYIFPFYYSSSLPHEFYQQLNKESSKTEVSFQISIKAPVIKNIFNSNTDLNLAYTQRSFWQAYENSAYVRETNYTPEIFFSTLTHYRPLLGGWRIKYLDLGLIHQSNGRGDAEERTWNRVYVASTLSKGNWMIRLKPWYVFNDRATQQYNPNIAHYLGYDSILVAYKCGQQVFSAERTNIESGVKRGSVTLTWSFPLTQKIKFYTEFFGGYGQSLTEYDRSVASVGVGIALNDWI